MGTSLWFPGGVPASIERLVDPDAIARITGKGLRSLRSEWKPLADLADQISHGKRRPWWKGIFKSTDIDPEWLHYQLYNEKLWPKTLTDDERKKLRILKSLRQLSGQHTRYQPEGVAPSPQEFEEALEMMSIDMEAVLRRMFRSFNAMLYKEGTKVEPLCEEIYGEPCEKGEGALLIVGDIEKMWKMDRLPVRSRPLERVLRDFLAIYFSSPPA